MTAASSARRVSPLELFFARPRRDLVAGAALVAGLVAVETVRGV